MRSNTAGRNVTHFIRECAKPHVVARCRKVFMSNWDLDLRLVNGGLAKVAALLSERLSASICLFTFRTEPIPIPPANPGYQAFVPC